MTVQMNTWLSMIPRPRPRSTGIHSSDDHTNKYGGISARVGIRVSFISKRQKSYKKLRASTLKGGSTLTGTLKSRICFLTIRNKTFFIRNLLSGPNAQKNEEKNVDNREKDEQYAPFRPSDVVQSAAGGHYIGDIETENRHPTAIKPEIKGSRRKEGKFVVLAHHQSDIRAIVNGRIDVLPRNPDKGRGK